MQITAELTSIYLKIWIFSSAKMKMGTKESIESSNGNYMRSRHFTAIKA